MVTKTTRYEISYLQDEIEAAVKEVPVKFLAIALGVSEQTVKGWRCYGIPQMLMRAAVFIVGNDRMWAACERVRAAIHDEQLEKRIAENYREIEELERRLAGRKGHEKTNRAVSGLGFDEMVEEAQPHRRANL